MTDRWLRLIDRGVLLMVVRERGYFSTSCYTSRLGQALTHVISPLVLTVIFFFFVKLALLSFPF